MKYIFIILALFTSFTAVGQDSTFYSSTEIVYGRKDGMALTMTRLTPLEKSKSRALVMVVSGNWTSDNSRTNFFLNRAPIYIKAGYTVFLVYHSSQPRYAIPDAEDDIRRAIRFIRYNAKDYGIDPDHIGITGNSSGGHLSLLAALLDDIVKPNARNPVDQVSSRVQAVAVFYPPVDFLNWGNTNPQIQKEILKRTRLLGAFDFKKFNDTTGIYESVQGDEAIKKIAEANSPIYAVTKDDPPVLIAHGDADLVVPLQQSKSLIQKLTEAGIPNELIIKEKGGHGWRGMEEQEQRFLEWFDKYLK